MKVEAFDSVFEKYFEKMMTCMGFGKKNKQRSLIHECISSSYLSISINGSPSHEFGVEHGLHLDVHPLYLIWQQKDCYFKGIDYANRDHLTHLQYTNDTLVFVPNDCKSLIHIERILRWFELASRLQVNFYKSSLVGINLDDEFTAVWLIQSTVKREYQVNYTFF